jgi:hypothetical protein
VPLLSSPWLNRACQVKFRDAADVTMEPWGVPSGGDWGLYRGGALFFEGTEDCVVKHCTFTRLDNNAIFLSGYNRRTTLADNDFAWLGLSAMAGWGYTDEHDGTGGQQPRDTSVLRNYVRVGLTRARHTRLAAVFGIIHPLLPAQPDDVAGARARHHREAVEHVVPSQDRAHTPRVQCGL